jgi:PAS domain S-box-containing protein
MNLTTAKEANHQVTLFSETDTHGIITFVNDYFCEVSGYTKEELIGRPHNIIRHPDMPGKLFEKLWAVIKRGEVFRAVIKNRAKNGSHYWVQATMMLSRDGGGVGKYISVRHLLNDDREAEQRYFDQARLFGF